MSSKKLQAVPPPKKNLPPPPEDDDEDDEDLDMDEEFDENMDMGVDILTSLLATEEGDTLATTLVTLSDNVERIATSLELQNKILVKVLGALKTKPEPIEQTPVTEEAA